MRCGSAAYITGLARFQLVCSFLNVSSISLQGARENSINKNKRYKIGLPKYCNKMLEKKKKTFHLEKRDPNAIQHIFSKSTQVDNQRGVLSEDTHLHSSAIILESHAVRVAIKCNMRIYRAGSSLQGQVHQRLSARSSTIVQKNSGRRSTELFTTIKTGDFENEQIAYHLALELGGEISSRFGRTSSGNDVVHNQDPLAFLDGILLHFEIIFAVLLDVLRRDTGSGKLSLLSDGSKTKPESQGKTRAKEKATGIESNNYIRLVAGKGLCNLHLKGGQESSMGVRVGEQGHDINKVNAGDREVGKLAKIVAQAHLSTGELGGGGGGGGGLSSRGILGS